MATHSAQGPDGDPVQLPGLWFGAFQASAQGVLITPHSLSPDVTVMADSDSILDCPKVSTKVQSALALCFRPGADRRKLCSGRQASPPASLLLEKSHIRQEWAVRVFPPSSALAGSDQEKPGTSAPGAGPTGVAPGAPHPAVCLPTGSVAVALRGRRQQTVRMVPFLLALLPVPTAAPLGTIMRSLMGIVDHLLPLPQSSEIDEDHTSIKLAPSQLPQPRLGFHVLFPIPDHMQSHGRLWSSNTVKVPW